MPTNEQRREAAKRKLERQLVRRQEMQKSRRQRTIIAGVIVAVVVIAGVIFLVTKKPAAQDASAASDPGATSAADPAAACTYADAETTVKAVSKPDNTNPLTSGTVDATISLSQGALPVTLDRSLGPCAVNAFISLAAQKFYDGTTCHRLTTADDFKILQCGDPSGTGRGGPGFSYAAETSPPVATDPTATDAATPDEYPVGTLAMANAAGGANGSQFFVVYGTSSLGSGYTKIGTVGTDGLAVIDRIAAEGTKAGPNGAQDAPNATVTVTSVSVPDDALTPTAEPTATESGTDTIPTDVLPTDAVPTDSGASEPSATDAGSTEAPADTTTADATAEAPTS